MTYAALHTDIFNRIREAKAWPDAGSSTKLQEQLDIIFAAVVVIGRTISNDLLGDSYNEAVLAPLGGSDPAQYTLPADLFIDRVDRGIVAVIVDGEYRFGADDFVALRTVQYSRNNPYQSGNPLVHVDVAVGSVFVANGSTVSLSYIQSPVLPVAGTYATDVVPLPDTVKEQLIQLVLTHVEAEQVGNMSKSQLHGLLSEMHVNAGANLTG